MRNKVTIIGAGLAGTEAAYQAAKRGLEVDLYEMRPENTTEAHTTSFPGEMVCSNSLGSTEITSALGLLKRELEELDSFYLACAKKNSVPAGSSLSVDRIALAKHIEKKLSEIKNIKIIREEVKSIPQTDHPLIIATGPLTSETFSKSLTEITMRKNLFFFDATSPVIDTQTIDHSKVYRKSRYNKGTADFINIPLNKDQYDELVRDLINGEKADVKDFEKNMYFESCLPVEEIAGRGAKTLAFGPLKPVGLEEPGTDKIPYAVVQLRQDDLKEEFYQMVGFQTRLKYSEQKRIFCKLPGLEKCRFERFGRMHRNSYINAPLIIDAGYRCKQRENIFFAGQISGVEGYVESISSGLTAGINAYRMTKNLEPFNFPQDTATGALAHYIANAGWQNFKPTKFTYGLLPTPGVRANKKEKKEIKAGKAAASLNLWIQNHSL